MSDISCMVNDHFSAATNAIATKCLLIIDDESDIREIVRVSLEYTRPWQVITAASGQEGLEIAQTQMPDAILLDMDLDDMDGYEFLAELSQRLITVHIPVIFLTANQLVNNQQQVMKASDLGVQGAIQKPFDPGLLANQIDTLLNWE